MNKLLYVADRKSQAYQLAVSAPPVKDMVLEVAILVLWNSSVDSDSCHCQKDIDNAIDRTQALVQ